MKMSVLNRKSFLFVLAILMITFSILSVGYAQMGTPTITASTDEPLTDVTLDGGMVKLTLNGGVFTEFRWDIADALSVSGIPGVTIGQGSTKWFDVDRLNDTEIEITLGFVGELEVDSVLTFTVGAGAIINYNGPALTSVVPVTVQPKTDTKGEQEKQILRYCEVGDVIAPGESCTYITDDGKNILFSVNEDGNACREGGPVTKVVFGLNVVVENLEFCVNYDIDQDETFDSIFAASKNANSTWKIITVPADTPENATLPQGQPDLMIQSIQINKNTLSPSEVFTLSSTIENSGNGQAYNTTVRFYRSTDNNISTSDTEIGSKTVSALETNQAIQLSIDLTAPNEAGTYYYGACVDNITDESNTQNNCSNAVSMIVTSPVTQPPTPVVDFSPSPTTSPYRGQQLTIALNISGAENVTGYETIVQYDNTALKYADSEKGDFLPSDSFFNISQPAENQIALTATALSKQSSNGDGTLATLTLEVLDIKPSTLTITHILLSDLEGITTTPEIQVGEIVEPQKIKGDINQDGVVNISDLILIASLFWQTDDLSADVNGDGMVNISDLVIVAGEIADSMAAPALLSQYNKTDLTRAQVEQWLHQANQLNTTDVVSQRGIIFLEQLLESFIPIKTRLLSNYPNPFNPETWIPYHLAKDAEVTLHIYAMNGALIRTISLGYRATGRYQTRARAAYWDGKNILGEPVASGLYFYTLTAGDFSATRKMLIRK